MKSVLLIIKDTQKYGRGVYAGQDIKIGQLIEVSPVIVSPKDECEYLEKTIFSNYFFYWGENLEAMALALGNGSLFNHSYTPNAFFYCNKDNLTILFYAIRDIKIGEEITINYNGDPNDKSSIWFDVID